MAEQSAVQPPEAKTIQAIVLEQLEQLGIKTASIVDDAFAPGIDVAGWLKFVEVVRDQDPDLYERIEDLVAKETGNVEQPPGDQVLYSVRRFAGKSSVPAVKALLQPAPTEPALAALLHALGGLGLEVSTSFHVDDAPLDSGLYFVDYRLQPEIPDTFGRDASRLITEALESTGPLGRAPGAVLMSRSQEQQGHPDVADQEAVSRNEGGFIRCNFRYFDKAFLADENRFYFMLHDLLCSVPVGREYYQQVRALRDAATVSVTKIAGETCSLLPVDFTDFANSLAGQPQDEERVADHLLSIFTGLLAAELRNNSKIQTAVKEFRDLLKKPGMMAPVGAHSHSLHRIHSKLIYDQSPATLKGDISFGDIYTMTGAPRSYFIVLTAECDLEPRALEGEQRGPKVERVLIVPGTPGELPKSDDQTVAGTPLFIENHQCEAQWIRWDLRHPRYMPWRRLRHERWFKKWGRLRAAEAEQIQLRVAVDLLAVGTDNVSSGVRVRHAVLWQVPSKETCNQVTELKINEMAPNGDGEKPLWALSAGCEHELCQEGRKVMTAEAVAALRRYIAKNQFISTLKKSGVGVMEEGATIHLGWFTSTYCPQRWLGPSKSPLEAGNA